MIMLRIDFHKPLSALEIREPIVKVCMEVGNEFELYALFNQRQQAAFDSHSRDRNRKRIGNGKHKDWFIDFQKEPTNASRPTVVGRIAVQAPICPEEMQFGGFDYGKYRETKPTYSYMKIHTPSELNYYRPVDPSPDLLDMTYRGLSDLFVDRYPRLFSVAELTN